MRNTYRGESPAKTFTREALWNKIQNRLFGNFKRGALVLCGPEAGDVRHLLAKGVTNITAVDKNPDSIANAMKLVNKNRPNSGVVYQCQSVEYCEGTFDAVFLDWCGTITEDSLAKSFRVGKTLLPTNKFLALGFSYSRDKNKGSKSNPVEQRIDIILDYIKRNKSPFKLVSSWSYFSGTPMLYLLFRRGGGKHCRSNHRVVRATEKNRETYINRGREAAKSYQDLVDVCDLYMAKPSSVPAWAAWHSRWMRKRMDEEMKL